jgi:hypothetical protein
MLGNRALQAGVTNVTGAAGGRTLGYNVTEGNIYPCDLLTVSTSGTATITLPSIAVPQYGGLGIGDSQVLRVLNLAAQSVILAAASGDSIVGKHASSATIAQNAAATCVSKATSATAGVWYTF